MKLAIAEIRKRRGLSQAVLAAKLHVTQEVISRIENQHRQVRTRELPLLAEALGCTIEELLSNLSLQSPQDTGVTQELETINHA